MLIAGAAAEIAFQAVTNLSLRWIGISIDDLTRRHDHSRCAIAALQAVFFPESFLHRMQIAIGGQAFNRGDVAAIRLHREHGAGLDRLSVERDGARTAERGLATD